MRAKIASDVMGESFTEPCQLSMNLSRTKDIIGGVLALSVVKAFTALFSQVLSAAPGMTSVVVQ